MEYSSILLLVESIHRSLSSTTPRILVKLSSCRPKRTISEHLIVASWLYLSLSMAVLHVL
ncbi:hypothetical protein BDQ17DRAFT_1346087 [Cyathus striatus]|nr:hypothetical protein BDQ17DRAFT_1346087 [Cyathus striatus]